VSTTIDGNTYVNGTLSMKTLAPSAGCVTDTSVSGSAAIQATKLQHQYTKNFAQVTGSIATTERRPFHSVSGATGTIVGFRAASTVACVGAATISIRLKKNGTNIDTAALVLDNTNTAYIWESAAGFTSTSLVAGDILECDVTATAGGGTLGQGLICELVTREDAQ